MNAAPTPPRDWLRELAPVAAGFALAGPPVSASPHRGGYINETYALACAPAPGSAPRRYILQKINERVFRDAPALMDNIRRVCAHLAIHSPRSLRLVPTLQGETHLRDTSGHCWRAYDFIERTRTADHVADEAQAREVARAFGEFQARLADLPGDRLHETIPGFHDTRRRFEALRAAVAADPLGRAAEVRAEIAFAFAREADTDILSALHARGDARECVVHNDAKIGNLLLDEATGLPAAVIDLDTVMPGLALHDFGEMMRTAASSTAEDDPDSSRMSVVPSFFRALVAGYFETAGPLLCAAERAHLAFAGKMMAYENGIRFLADYIQGDVYYRITRPSQNIDRCRAQFALVRDIEDRKDQLARIVADLHASP